jgi:hypothetical protein
MTDSVVTELKVARTSTIENQIGTTTLVINDRPMKDLVVTNWKLEMNINYIHIVLPNHNEINHSINICGSTPAIVM